MLTRRRQRLRWDRCQRHLVLGRRIGRVKDKVRLHEFYTSFIYETYILYDSNYRTKIMWENSFLDHVQKSIHSSRGRSIGNMRSNSYRSLMLSMITKSFRYLNRPFKGQLLSLEFWTRFCIRPKSEMKTIPIAARKVDFWASLSDLQERYLWTLYCWQTYDANVPPVEFPIASAQKVWRYLGSSSNCWGYLSPDLKICIVTTALHSVDLILRIPLKKKTYDIEIDNFHKTAKINACNGQNRNKTSYHPHNLPNIGPNDSFHSSNTRVENTNSSNQ